MKIKKTKIIDIWVCDLCGKEIEDSININECEWCHKDVCNICSMHFSWFSGYKSKQKIDTFWDNITLCLNEQGKKFNKVSENLVQSENGKYKLPNYNFRKSRVFGNRLMCDLSPTHYTYEAEGNCLMKSKKEFQM